MSPSFILIHNYGQNHSSICFTLYAGRDQTLKQNFPAILSSQTMSDFASVRPLVSVLFLQNSSFVVLRGEGLQTWWPHSDGRPAIVQHTIRLVSNGRFAFRAQWSTTVPLSVYIYCKQRQQQFPMSLLSTLHSDLTTITGTSCLATGSQTDPMAGRTEIKLSYWH